MEDFKEVMRQEYLKTLADKEKKNGAKDVEYTLESILHNMSFLAETVKSFDEENKYLPLNTKKMLAYLLSPTNRVEYVVRRGDNWVECEASFYESETSTAPSGKGFAKSFRSQVYKGSYLSDEERESCLEAYVRGRAASRAYTDAGIGLQFYADNEDSDRDEAAEGIEAKVKAQNNAPKTETDSSPATVPQKSVSVGGMNLPVPPTQNELKAAKQQKKAKKTIITVPEAETEVPEPETKVETTAEPEQKTSKEEMTPAKAMLFIADNGTLSRGKSLGDIFTSEDPKLRRSLVWLYKNPPESRESDMNNALLTLINLDDGLKQLM